MSNVTESIDVDVPVSTVYDQWTQFETFPQFMEGVERIDQITDTKTHWVTKIGGVEREFDATSPSSTRMSGLPGSPRPEPTRPAS